MSAAKATDKPQMPRPGLALNIGICGHRPNKLTAALQKLTAQNFKLLADDITVAATDILRADGGKLYAGTKPILRMVTGLAEGADRLVLSNMPADWQFEAILPMPRAIYAADFEGPARKDFDTLLAQAASVTELPLQNGLDARKPAGRAGYYAFHAEFLLRQIDVLVAIWDGKSADGPGGTGDSVDKALEMGLSVIWISLEKDAPIRVLTPAQHEDGQPETRELGSQQLAHMLQHVLAPRQPEEKHDDHGHGSHAAAKPDKLPEFLNRRWPGALYLPFAYNLLRKVSGAGRFSLPLRYGSLNEQLNSWSAFFKSVATQDKTLEADLTAKLLPRAAWADALAWYYGQLYRSAYVSIFFLAGLSVPIGLCYLFFLSSPAVLHIKAAFVVIELAIITTVIVVVRRGVRADWHGQWLQTRKLSELLRLGRNLAYVGASRSLVTTPEAGESEDLADFLVRATFRETGLPDTVLDQAYLKRVLSGINESEIAQQRAYHKSNAANLGKIHHLLHHAGDLSFQVTIGFLLFYLVVWAADLLIGTAHAEGAEAAGEGGSLIHEALEFIIKPIVSIAAAGLPAFGAALTGIREQGDFEGFAERSHETQVALSAIHLKINALLADPTKLDLPHAQNLLLSATQVMAKDVTAWHQQFATKRLSLPA